MALVCLSQRRRAAAVTGAVGAGTTVISTSSLPWAWDQRPEGEWVWRRCSQSSLWTSSPAGASLVATTATAAQPALVLHAKASSILPRCYGSIIASISDGYASILNGSIRPQSCFPGRWRSPGAVAVGGAALARRWLPQDGLGL